ncbi:acetyltransferase [Thermodesulfobacteriota bacterium]
MEKVLILGAGPLARIVPDIALSCGQIQIVGFVDTANERHFLMGDAAELPVFEAEMFPENLKSQMGAFKVLIASDNMEMRSELIARAKEEDWPLANIIHPSAVISPSIRLGQGILISSGVIIGPGATIGDHVILNSAVTVDHDSILEGNIIIAPGVHIPGHVVVKPGTFIGVGSCCVPGLTIGKNCMVGAGSVVTKNIPDNVVAAGVPAKIIRTRQ